MVDSTCLGHLCSFLGFLCDYEDAWRMIFGKLDPENPAKSPVHHWMLGCCQKLVPCAGTGCSFLPGHSKASHSTDTSGAGRYHL